MKKPAKFGLGEIIRNGKPVLFTRQGAQREADRLAKKSCIKDAVGLVSDCGDYWRINVAGQPIENFI